MIIQAENIRLQIPNLLLIAGNARNVGKTTLACKIIRRFTSETDVTGLKITPHFHPVKNADVVYKTDNFVIVNEKQFSNKDSSLMLQAGAKQVFFVMAKREFYNEAVTRLLQLLPENLIVCESGGLHEWVTPGLFFMVKLKDETIVKTHLLVHSPIIINNDGQNFDFDINRLEFSNRKIIIKN
ncbi:MAG: hypothetical protein EP310_05745 [Bacteroidetes bacterium]|nr:MAG: hypothetical protein EP310_05745 [Bacteroidota bacterium]